jgi:hypothetical protein
MKRSLWASMVLAFVLCSPAAADDPKGDPPPDSGFCCASLDFECRPLMIDL